MFFAGVYYGITYFCRYGLLYGPSKFGNSLEMVQEMSL